MKTERLLSIVIYLLNHDTVSAAKLAERFEVSKRTILRDMEQISYVNALGGASSRFVEPLALNYRWYSWYLLAYCQTKQDYRIFKLVRISEYESTRKPFGKEHGDPAALLEQAFQGNERKGLYITLLCKADMKIQICEYLGGTIIDTLDNGDFIMRLYVLYDERMWFAMLLSFGDSITVLEPKELKIRLKETAVKIITLYK